MSDEQQTLYEMLREIAFLEILDTQVILAVAQDTEYQGLQDAHKMAMERENELNQAVVDHPLNLRRQASLRDLEAAQSRYKEALVAYHQETGKKPFQGSGLAVTEDASIQMSDEAAALEWFRVHMPICLKIDLGMVRKFAPGLKALGLPWLTVAPSYRVSIPDLAPFYPEETGKPVVNPVTGEIA